MYECWWWARQQTEFLRHFKLKAMFASIPFARKMLDDSTPIIPFPERGLPNKAETTKLFRKIFPPVKKENPRINV
jgi:hypothetical protein